MSAKSEILVEMFEFAFSALDRTLEDMDEIEYMYRLTETSNDIQLILNHLSRITNLNMLRIIKGEFEYLPQSWPSDYIEHKYSIGKLRDDIKKGSENVLEGITGLSEEKLEEILPLMSGSYPRKIGLYAYLA